jgi:hypothetical protein
LETATNVVIDDVVTAVPEPDSPFVASMGSITTTQGTVESSGSLLTGVRIIGRIGTLAPGASAIVRVTVNTSNIAGGGELRSVASASSDGCETTPTDNTLRSTLVVRPDTRLLISRLSPSSVAAGDPGFTLTVTGQNFSPDSEVFWNGNPRPTTRVSSAELRATILSTDVATSGSAAVTVRTTTAVSNPLVLTIGTPRLVVASATATRLSSGNWQVHLTLRNDGNATARTIRINTSTLNRMTTLTTLPAVGGDLAPGASMSANLVFPKTAAVSGSTAIFAYTSNFGGGTRRVTIP